MPDGNKIKKIGGVELSLETYCDRITQKPTNTKIYAPKTQEGWRVLRVVEKILTDKTSAIPQRIETHDTFGLDIQPYNGNEQYVNKDKLNLASAIPENIDVFLALPHVPIRMYLATLERLYDVREEPMPKPKESFVASNDEKRAAKIYVNAIRALLKKSNSPTDVEVKNALIVADLEAKTIRGVHSVIDQAVELQIRLGIMYKSQDKIAKYMEPIMKLLSEKPNPTDAELEEVIVIARREFIRRYTKEKPDSFFYTGPEL